MFEDIQQQQQQILAINCSCGKISMCDIIRIGSDQLKI